MQHLDPCDPTGVESQRQANWFGPDGGMQITKGNGQPGDAIGLGWNIDHPAQTTGNQLCEPKSTISAAESDLEGAPFRFDIHLQSREG